MNALCLANSSQNSMETEYAKILDPLISNRLIPGYYLAVFKNGDKVIEKADGLADEEISLVPSGNTLYAIASMTKPLTALAMLKLIETSEIQLYDPIERYLPSFEGMLVAVAGSYETELQPVNRSITIFDLLTHTSGLTYSSGITGVGDISDTYESLEIFSLRASSISVLGDLKQHVGRLSELPLVEQPGTVFTYSVGPDVAGRIIEIVSGKTFRQYLKASILEPLEMFDTDFLVKKTDYGRLARLYSPLKRTYQVPGTPKMYQRANLLDSHLKNFGIETQMTSGGSGLISTANDFAKFMNFLLQKSSDNPLGLSQESFDLMLNDQLGKRLGPDLMLDSLGEGASNQVFSLGLGIALEDNNEEAFDYDYLHWSGAHNTLFCIDPDNKVSGIFMTQIFPPIFGLLPELEQVADNFLAE